MHSYRLLLAMAFSLGSRTFAARLMQTLDIVNSPITADYFTRPAVSVSGRFPGPLVAVNKGDQISMNVVDNLVDPSMRRATSIHWHGLFQNGSNEMDGVSFLNQCPIIPGGSFLYNFDTANQTGTYWYHSHLSTQYCDGLRGPLVIYDPQDPHKSLYDVDDATTVITLADWYHATSTSLFPNPEKAPPIPDTTTINGLGRNSVNLSSPLAVIHAQPGKRHRFRIVSTSCFPFYTFSIDGHQLTVIETDGVETQPITVDSIEVHAGQRYSVIVNANQAVGNYWIRANPNAGATGFKGGINSAILRYSGAPTTGDPTSSLNPNPVLLNEANVVPLENPGVLGNKTADISLNFILGRDKVSHNLTMNGTAFVPPSVPVLLQILSGNVAAGSIMPNGSVYSLPRNKVVEISIPGGGNHPFHLHGHNFDVVRVAGSSTYNYNNPIRRDVVSTGKEGDNVTFRFFTNNPGPWFLHCHIDWHLEAGLAIVFAEDPANTGLGTNQSRMLQWDTLCPNYNANNPDKAFE